MKKKIAMLTRAGEFIPETCLCEDHQDKTIPPPYDAVIDSWTDCTHKLDMPCIWCGYRYDKTLPLTLANEFSKVLRQWLTPEQMDAVVVRNVADAGQHVCHSHDFCDANMAMAEALKNIVGRDTPYSPEDDDPQQEFKYRLIEADVDLINAAWSMAKQAAFTEII